MEVKGLEAITKPERQPDYVTTYGSAYWWVEMVRMDASNGGFQRIAIDQETGNFHIVLGEGRKKTLADNIKQQYDSWWYETFESKFLGNSADEDTDTKS